MRDYVLSGASFGKTEPLVCTHEALYRMVDLFTGASFRYSCWACGRDFNAVTCVGNQRDYERVASVHEVIK